MTADVLISGCEADSFWQTARVLSERDPHRKGIEEADGRCSRFGDFSTNSGTRHLMRVMRRLGEIFGHSAWR